MILVSILAGVVALGAFGGYAAYKKIQLTREFNRFTSFIEKITFQSVPFQKREEMGYDIYFFQEEKFSVEIWKKEDSLYMYVNDDELKKPIFRIEKKKEGVQVYHPTIFYYRTVFEKKKKLIQSFVHRYVANDFLSVPNEEKHTIPMEESVENIEEMPKEIQEKIKEIKEQYEKLMAKKDELTIEAYTLIETLIFNDLKRMVSSYKELSPESQNKYENDVLEGLNDIHEHLKHIEDRFEQDNIRELQKTLRVLKERRDE